MRNIYEESNKLKKIYTVISNILLVMGGIMSCILWLIKKIDESISCLPKAVANVLISVYHLFVVVFVICLIVIFVRIVSEGIKNKARGLYIQRKLTEFIHKSLIHRIRDKIVELEPVSEKMQGYFKSSNSDAIEECYMAELNKLKSNLKKIIDELAEYLTKYRQTEISVCIKIFKNRDRNRNEFQSEEIIPIARSSNTEQKRKNDKQTIVGHNTDFTNLSKGQMIFFGSSNLQQINESGQYINDSENWEANKYTSTLVTPIRYNNINANDGIRIKHDIIGFLCIDSEEVIKEWENADSFELQLLATFSDILYVYIKEFYKCFEKTGIL